MTELTAAMREAIKWLKSIGADCAVAVHKSGGRSYLAQGETGHFMPSTMKKLCDAGLAEYYAVGERKNARLRLTPAGIKAA